MLVLCVGGSCLPTFPRKRGSPPSRHDWVLGERNILLASVLLVYAESWEGHPTAAGPVPVDLWFEQAV